MTVLLLFLFEFILSLFLLWLLWLGLPKLHWIVVVRVGNLVLFLILVEMVFQFFTIENDVGCGLIICGLYYVEVCCLYTHFLESFFFYHKWMLNFVNCFFYIYWDDHMVFILQFVNVVYHFDWFVNIEPSLHPWDKSYFIMVYDPFNVLLNSVC